MSDTLINYLQVGTAFLIIILVFCVFWFLLVERKPGPRKKGRLKFKAGTICTCPECDKYIGMAKYDIYSGSLMKSSDWNSNYITLDATFRCPDCDTLYVKRLGDNIKMHTTKGWEG